MDRRLFIAGMAATIATPVLATTGRAYQPGLVKAELAAGRTVFVDFYTDWCSTCRAQERVIEGLKAENPAYEQAISFIAVDWDIHSGSELARSLNIPRRSTLVALKGDAEIGRLVADTRAGSIKALMDAALASALA